MGGGSDLSSQNVSGLFCLIRRAPWPQGWASPPLASSFENEWLVNKLTLDVEFRLDATGEYWNVLRCVEAQFIR